MEMEIEFKTIPLNRGTIDAMNTLLSNPDALELLKRRLRAMGPEVPALAQVHDVEQFEVHTFEDLGRALVRIGLQVVDDDFIDTWRETRDEQTPQ